jgi:hypothetical protein
MLDRRAYDFVAAEFERRKRAGESPAVQVHLTSGETLVVDMVYSSADSPGWLTFRTSGEEDATEFVPLEYIHHVTVTDASDSERPFGFAIEEHPALDPPAA